MTSDLIFAPWSADEVAALNRWQKAGTVHPFTCTGLHEESCDLIATPGGWVCLICGYQQKWAHRMMLSTPPWPDPLPFSMPPLTDPQS